MLIIVINGEETIIYQGTLDDLNHHQTPCGKIQGQYQYINKEELPKEISLRHFPRFDQVRPVISHLEVRPPDKPITTNNIDEYLKNHQRQLFKGVLFLQYYKNKNVSLLLDTIPIKYLPEGSKSLC